MFFDYGMTVKNPDVFTISNNRGWLRTMSSIIITPKFATTSTTIQDSMKTKIHKTNSVNDNQSEESGMGIFDLDIL